MGCSRPWLGFASPAAGLLWYLLVTCALATGEQPTAYCVVSVHGSGSGSGPIQSFSWSCTNISSNLTVGVDKSLAAFKSRAEGITFSSSCSKAGCLITVCGSTPLVLWYSSFTGVNVAGVESVLCTADSSQVTITNSTFSGNRPRAVQARDTANVTIIDSKIADNGLPRADGGGVWLGAGSPSLTMLNGTVSGNKARSGGGFWLGGSATAVINSSSISGNQGSVVPGTPSGLGGGLAVTDSATVALGGNTTVNGNTAGTSGAGVFSAGSAALIVSPGVKFGLNQVVNKSYGYDVVASGASRLELPPVTFTDYTSAGPADISKCSKGVALERSPCGVGEFRDNRTGVCMCCPERTYSFDASGTCLPCPENGACPGGNALEPLPGYWRSSNESTQMHLCPLGKVSCAGGGKCQQGYTGRLCAGCDRGYGTTGPLRCAKCVKPTVAFGLYLCMCIGTVIFVAITVHFTYADNVEGSNDLRPSDLIKILVLYVQYHAIIGCILLPWPQFYVNLLRASELVFGIGAGSALNLQCWAPFLAGRPKDNLPTAMRVHLVTLLTPALVFAAVVVLRILWWALMLVVHRLLRSTPSSCVTPGCVKLAQPSTLRALARKLPVTVMVVLFFGYPTLLRTSLRFLACLPIDSAVPGSLVKLLSHKQGYLMIDPNQECFAGWHRGWAFGVGIPTVLLMYVVIPVGLFWLLKANQHRAGELRFRETFGFLYRNHRPNFLYYEAVTAVQTVALSAVAVQHFWLGPYTALLLMSLLFFVFGGIQMACRPYTHQKLHIVHYGASAVLFLTTLAGLAMFHVEGQAPPQEISRVAIALLALVLDVGFVAWCLIEVVVVASSGNMVKSVTSKVLGCVNCGADKQSNAGVVGRLEESMRQGSGLSEYPTWFTGGSSSGLVVVDSAQQLNKQLKPNSRVS